MIGKKVSNGWKTRGLAGGGADLLGNTLRGLQRMATGPAPLREGGGAAMKGGSKERASPAQGAASGGVLRVAVVATSTRPARRKTTSLSAAGEAKAPPDSDPQYSPRRPFHSPGKCFPWTPRPQGGTPLSEGGGCLRTVRPPGIPFPVVVSILGTTRCVAGRGRKIRFSEFSCSVAAHPSIPSSSARSRAISPSIDRIPARISRAGGYSTGAYSVRLYLLMERS